MEKVFTEVYERNEWGNDNNSEYAGSSGPGSTINYNIEYIKFLKNFINDNRINTVIDLGCGDCKCLKSIYDDIDVQYTGYDCYKNIVEYNLKYNSSDKYKFFHLDFYRNKEDIISGDICILKDVLHHWDLESIYNFMNYLVDSNKFKFILIINCCYQIKHDTDINTGYCHCLSADYFPLKKYKPTKLFNYHSKQISVIYNNKHTYSKYHYLTTYEEDEEHRKKVMDNIFHVYSQDLLPRDHVNFLENVLHKKFNIEPQIIYDIGGAVLHWQRWARKIWYNSKIYVFDAFSPLEELYKKARVDYNICCLSDKDDVEIKFYQNDMLFGGNSIFKEINDDVFPEDNYVVKKTITLDTIVHKNNIPYPDLIKIDCQGNELNIIKGATQVLKCCSYLILELQQTEYNRGAPLKHEVIEYLKSIGFVMFCEDFSKNIADSDSCFINVLRTNVISNSLF